MSYEFKIERMIDASPEEVFDTITDPATQREWWTDGGHVDTAGEVRTGGSAFVEWETDSGTICRAEQTYLEVERPHRLVFNETVKEPSSPVYECTLTMTFEDRDGKTLYTLHHVGFPSEEERDLHQGGTLIFLERFERYLAKRRVA